MRSRSKGQAALPSSKNGLSAWVRPRARSDEQKSAAAESARLDQSFSRMERLRLSFSHSRMNSDSGDGESAGSITSDLPPPAPRPDRPRGLRARSRLQLRRKPPAAFAERGLAGAGPGGLPERADGGRHGGVQGGAADLDPERPGRRRGPARGAGGERPRPPGAGAGAGGSGVALALDASVNSEGEPLSPKQRLEVLLQREENRGCADCCFVAGGGGGGGAVGAGGAGGGAAFPWASTTLGVFLCIECAGVHRGLGAAVSAVRSVALDAWGPAEAAAMERRGGNALANACWEYHVPSDWPKPSAKEDREYRADYIKAKYVAQLFAQRPRRPARPRPRPGDGEGGAAPSSSGPGPGPAGALRNGSGDGAGMVMFIGILNITLIKGQKLTSSAQHHKHLPKRNHNIYCTFRLGKQEIRSKKVKGKSSAGCNPEWDENLMLCWDGHSKFEINVYSDVASLGSATTDLRQLLLSSSSPIDASATSVTTPGSIDSSGGGRNLSQELWEASLGQNHHSDSLRNGTGGRSLLSMEEQSRTGHGGGNPLNPNFIPDQADSGEVWVLLDGDESYVRKRSSSDSPIVMGRKDIPSFFNQPRQNDSLTANTYNNNNKVVLDEQDPIPITNELSRKDSASAPATPSEKTSRKKRTFLPKSTGKKKTTSTQLHNGHVEATERAQEEEVVCRVARSLSPPPSSNILSNSSSPSTSVISKKKRSFLPRSAIKKERSGAANHNNLAVSNQDSSIPLEQKGSIQIRLSFSKLDS